MNKLLLIAAALLVGAPLLASATAYVPRPSYAGVYQTYNPTITDYFYTTNYPESYASLSNGYSSQGVPFYIEQTPQAHTIALHRYWKGAPSTEHVYITPDQYPQDLVNVTNAGYTYQGIAGYIYPKSLVDNLAPQLLGGMVPLYRLAKFNGANNDLQHKFTISESEKNTLIGQGWSFDHVEGYVPRWTVNAQFLGGFPTFTGGHVITRRCAAGAQCPGGASFRNGYNGYKFVNSTTKPAGTTTQVMTFDLFSPDLFSAGQQEHIAIGMHGHWNIDLSNIDNAANLANNHHALGIIIGASSCGLNVRVEAFWPTGNNLSPCNGQGNMLNNQTYRFRIAVTDSGMISYTVHTISPSGLVIAQVASDVVDSGGLFTGKNYGFPSGDTGYFIIPATMSNNDYSIYFSNLNVTWQ
ncbi:hypothetical protein [Lysobacter capsici]|uniref:hypothetical protein n=1 Tax=Lysobacter capsici TaxID=435897 RepID=UPI00287B6C69|nr:hypothetical protein [Lysobacter capsici]WND81895.1 hypothetical protein RJ610_05890 [Lysobacter capsici]WND87091.1 hypothetical protein RJ609_05895 [Lysobacter capsici]